jgi:hypothetical protein
LAEVVAAYEATRVQWALDYDGRRTLTADQNSRLIQSPIFPCAEHLLRL